MVPVREAVTEPVGVPDRDAPAEGVRELLGVGEGVASTRPCM